jgi:hypothetical protein
MGAAGRRRLRLEPAMVGDGGWVLIEAKGNSAMRGYWSSESWLTWGIGAAVLLTGVAPGWPQQTGYRISSDQVIVDSARHWRNWTYAQGTIEISADGRVQPRRRLRPVNAVLDIVDYLRLHPTAALVNKKAEEISLLDAIQAGSNKNGVVRALDGDPNTYWEPEWPSGQGDLAVQWWFVVDLGRLVFANRIVLRFADEGQGDPFLLFDVLISDGTKPARVPGSPLPEFKPALRMLQPNKSQRVFEIDLRGVEKEVQSEGLRFVQVVVTGSDLDRGHEVTPLEHAQLGPADRGAIDYHKLLRDGQEVVVDQDIYEQLPEDRRGAIRYHRRERPRLAELEVWTEGEEILNGCIARGGTMVLSAKEASNLGSFVDGDLESSSNIIIAAVQNVSDMERELFYDLGSFFWIDTQRMAFPGSGYYRNSFGDYRLDFSDGSRAVDGSLKWTTVVDREQSPVVRRFEGNRFPPIKARYFRVQYTMIIGYLQTTKLAEIQLYGEGYQPEVSLESDLIRLGGNRNLVSIEWEATAPLGTQVQIQTRAGSELGQLQHYFKKDGTEVTESQYKKLLSVYKGDITVEEVPGSDWSDWSESYEDPRGSVVTSPSPREYLKVRATLSSVRPDLGATLRSIRLNFVDPVAQQLVGEVTPVQVEHLGLEQPFSLYVRPQFGAGDPGFDGLLVVAPPDMRLQLAGLYSGAEGELGAGADLAGRAVSGVSVVSTGPDSLHLVFPRVQRSSGVELLRLDFRTALYSAGALLQVSLQNRALGAGSWQRVDGGEATRLGDSNGLVLVGGTAERGKAIRSVAVRPATFTPNGDGVNDVAEFTFTVVRVGDDTPVLVEVFDLGGRLVRRLQEQRDLSAGVYAVAWDGRDKAGRLVPPGIYLARLGLDTETQGLRAGDLSVLRLVHLAY